MKESSRMTRWDLYTMRVWKQGYRRDDYRCKICTRDEDSISWNLSWFADYGNRICSKCSRYCWCLEWGIHSKRKTQYHPYYGTPEVTHLKMRKYETRKLSMYYPRRYARQKTLWNECYHWETSSPIRVQSSLSGRYGESRICGISNFTWWDTCWDRRTPQSSVYDCYSGASRVCKSSDSTSSALYGICEGDGEIIKKFLPVSGRIFNWLWFHFFPILFLDQSLAVLQNHTPLKRVQTSIVLHGAIVGWFHIYSQLLYLSQDFHRPCHQ